MTEVMQIILRAGFRAMLVAPLIRGEEIVGSGGVTGLGL
jgi:predicted CoA-binding protein